MCDNINYRNRSLDLVNLKCLYNSCVNLYTTYVVLKNARRNDFS